jgi:hypothetical protein
MKVALPKAEPVPARLRPQFIEVASQARATIERVANTSPAHFE